MGGGVSNEGVGRVEIQPRIFILLLPAPWGRRGNLFALKKVQDPKF